MDKTGTLTKAAAPGRSPADGAVTGEAPLIAAASVEQLSEHPLATAIVAAAQARGFTLPAAKISLRRPAAACGRV